MAAVVKMASIAILVSVCRGIGERIVKKVTLSFMLFVLVSVFCAIFIFASIGLGSRVNTF